MRTYSGTKATGIKHRKQCAYHLPQMSELAIPSHKNTLNYFAQILQTYHVHKQRLDSTLCMYWDRQTEVLINNVLLCSHIGFWGLLCFLQVSESEIRLERRSSYNRHPSTNVTHHKNRWTMNLNEYQNKSLIKEITDPDMTVVHSWSQCLSKNEKLINKTWPQFN